MRVRDIGVGERVQLRVLGGGRPTFHFWPILQKAPTWSEKIEKNTAILRTSRSGFHPYIVRAPGHHIGSILGEFLPKGRSRRFLRRRANILGTYFWSVSLRCPTFWHGCAVPKFQNMPNSYIDLGIFSIAPHTFGGLSHFFDRPYKSQVHYLANAKSCRGVNRQSELRF